MTHYINKDFLLREGWAIYKEYPLFIILEHPKNNRVFCSIGNHGEFSIVEYHWCNDTEIVRSFSAINPNLTQDDYKIILKLTGIDAPNEQEK